MDLRDFLGLRRVDESRWAFEVTERLITPGHFLYGGAGLAAGLAALEEASGRPTVWGSAQYLAHAPTGATVTLTSELAVVGRRVTQARAVARVEEREILTVNAALGSGTLSSPVPWVSMPDVPAPLECPERYLPDAVGANLFAHVESRVARGRLPQDLDGTPGSPHSAVWVRLPGHLEPSAATLAIFGDYVSGGAMEPMGARTFGRSLDNTVRVATLEPTEWVLCEITMHALVDGIGQGIALLWSDRGTLLATASQSFVARLR
ncbi:MAG: thioesterase family protein [Acidobacteriota bacterium]|nr:thioesterase family protein [Acidobacteriota bacterium]